MTILEFPAFDLALAWYHSPEFARLLNLRTKTAARFDVILVKCLSEEEFGIMGRLDPPCVERVSGLEV